MLKNNNTKVHGLSEIGPNVPAFLVKLWKLVNDPETDELICWSEYAMSFIIHKPTQFAKELLSLYYKHNNMASFIRQLNMYGFHKIVSDVVGTKNYYMEFAHQYFIKDHAYLLENIKRKLPNPKTGVISNDQISNANMKNGTQSEILAKILNDVNNLKGKQESWDARLATMKRENEALWRELAIFRQKHLKQEQIINRLIHFIVTIVQPSRNVPLRRRYPLMINDIPPVKKITKLSGPDSANISQGSPTGPTIHEIDTTDVLFSPEQPETSSTDIEFIQSNLIESPKYVKVEDGENTSKESVVKSPGKNSDCIPEDWLGVEMAEDADLIDPLTPIDPAKINPAVAAATLKHLEGSKKSSAPIAITIPSVTTTTESGKKKVTEKKIIYLTDINGSDKNFKKIGKKLKPLTLNISSKKSSNSDANECSSSSSDLLLNLVSKSGEMSSKSSNQPAATTAKRKLSGSSSKATSPKSTKIPNKRVKKADSKSCVPELEIDDLEFLLTAKQPDDVVAESKEPVDEEKTIDDDSGDPFLKLQSLYNGTISEDQLISPETTLDIAILKQENKSVEDGEGASAVGLVDEETFSKEDENTDDVLNFDPDSMAVVCQQPGGVENLTRELSSHVDSVQGEIDYLKEILKGEGCNFDANSLPWLFSDDPLSYGVLPPAEEENNEKKNEEAGNELMTYGATNLMDLVDMIGSTPSNQEWANVLSPSSPVVTDLTTPAPSPSTFAFPSPNKIRKKEKKPQGKKKGLSEGDEPTNVPFIGLFQFSSEKERFFIFFGLLLVVGSACLPLLVNILYGEFANMLIDRTNPKPGVPSSPTILLQHFGGGKVLVNASAEERSKALRDDSFAWGVGCFSISLAQTILCLSGVFLLSFIASQQVKRIKGLLFSSILCKDLAWFDLNVKGNYITKCHQNLMVVEKGIGNVLAIFIYQMVAGFTNLLVSFIYGWLLALILSLLLFPLLIPIYLQSKVQSKLNSKEGFAFSRASDVLEEVVTHIKTVVAFEGEKKELKRYASSLEESKRIARKREVLVGISQGLLWFIIYNCYTVAFAVGIRIILVSREDQTYHFTPGDLFTVFFGMVAGVVNIGFGSAYIGNLNEACTSATTVFHVIHTKSFINPCGKDGTAFKHFYGDIEFKNVHFAYPLKPQKKILNGLNLKINPGEVVAIVGEHNSGKTTILNLVLRFYDPNLGAVYLDGYDSVRLNVTWIRKNIGFVAAEPFMFNGTIYDNITYGNPSSTQSEVYKAAKDADCHDFIIKLEKEYSTVYNKRTTNLSWSQRQRIALARALVRNPKILILDEVTSRLQPGNESSLLSGAEAAIRGRTTLIATKWVQTISQADRIIVMDDGDIVEEGIHEDLLKLKGVYYRLLRSGHESKDKPDHPDSATQPWSDAEGNYYDAEKNEFADVAGKNNTVPPKKIEYDKKKPRKKPKRVVKGGKPKKPVEGDKTKKPVEGDKTKKPVEGDKTKKPVEGDKAKKPEEKKNEVEDNKPVENAKSIDKIKPSEEKMKSIDKIKSVEKSKSILKSKSVDNSKVVESNKSVEKMKSNEKPVEKTKSTEKMKSIENIKSLEKIIAVDKSKIAIKVDETEEGEESEVEIPDKSKKTKVEKKKVAEKEKRKKPEGEKLENAENGDQNGSDHAKKSGRRRISLQRTRSSFVIDSFTSEQPPVPFSKLLQWSKPDWCYIAVGFISAIIGGTALPAACFMFGDAFRVVSLPDNREILERSNYYAFYLLVIAAIAGVCIFLQIYCFTVVGINLSHRLRIKAFDCILSQEVAWFEEQKQSKTHALRLRLARDPLGVELGIGSCLGLCLQSGASMTIGLFLSFFMEWRVTLVTLATLPVLALGIITESVLLKDPKPKERFFLQKITEVGAEVLNNIKIVAAFGRESAYSKKYNAILNKTVRFNLRTSCLIALSFALSQTAPFYSYSITLWYGGNLVSSEAVEVSHTIIISELLIFGAWTLAQCGVLAPFFLEARKSAGRLMYFFLREPLISDGHLNAFPDMKKDGVISYSKVYFSSPNTPNFDILKGLNFSMTCGQSIGIIGPVGSGKTSMLQLLLRFYDPTNGFIYVNDIDIKHFKLSHLRKKLGIVSQEPTLFSRTIQENIAYGDNSRTVPFNEIETAARAANIHEFIVSLPKGYETQISTVINKLSKAQKQQLSIARMMIRKPQVLLLDNCSANFDHKTTEVFERILHRNYKRKGKTVVITGNKFKFPKSLDTIGVLVEGHIMEYGTHTYLMQIKGLYYLMQNDKPEDKELPGPSQT